MQTKMYMTTSKVNISDLSTLSFEGAADHSPGVETGSRLANRAERSGIERRAPDEESVDPRLPEQHAGVFRRNRAAIEDPKVLALRENASNLGDRVAGLF